MKNTLDLNCLKAELYEKVSALKTSTDCAIENLSKSYGDNHPIIDRLRSYYMGIDACLSDISLLDLHLEKKDYNAIDSTANRIQGISEMIKDDARDLLLSIQTGFDDIPDDFLWN